MAAAYRERGSAGALLQVGWRRGDPGRRSRTVGDVPGGLGEWGRRGLGRAHGGSGRRLEFQVAGRAGDPAVGGALAGLNPKTTQKPESPKPRRRTEL